MKKTIVIVLVIIIFLVIGYGIYKIIPSKEETKPSYEVKGYNYVLYNNMSSTYKSLFHKLSTELEKEEIDEKVYATLISKMFLIDFYTLSDKITKNDVGGVEFIYTPARENFVLEASDTIYKYVENNIDSDRTQELPKVKEVAVDDTNITTTSYTHGDIIDDNAYQIKATITYENDLGYPTNIVLILIHTEIEYEEKTISKLEIVSVKEGV